MRRRAGSPALLVLSPLLALSAGCGDETVPSSQPDAGLPPIHLRPFLGTVDDIMATLPQSCAFQCAACPEPDTAYACPALKPWTELPHADACEVWDGKYPEPVQGKCAASEPTGEAAMRTGPHPMGGLVLPDGHRMRPAGREVVFDESDLNGGFPMSIIALAGTRFALVSDGGIRDNALRLIDLDALAGNGAPVSSYARFQQPSSLFYGMAFLPPDRALASGGGDGRVYAFDVDTATGALTRAMARDIDLGAGTDAQPYYSGALALTGDGTKLLVAPSEHADSVLVISLAAADYGAKVATIVLGSKAIFDLSRDPFDPAGKLFYASDMTQSRLVEIDAEAGVVTRTVALDKNPAQMAFLDATYLAVTEQDSDELAIVNRAAGTVDARIQVFEAGAPHGFSPGGLAWDAAKKRLYAALAGVNAVEAYDVKPGAPPVVTPVGRIPTAWWPTGLMVDADGSLVVIAGKGHGGGTDGKQYPWGQGPITERMRGSIQRVDAADLADLSASSAAVEQGRDIAALPGRSEIACPGGAADFPIPATNTAGPSALIKHVIVVVRENKTYDGVFGDRKDLGDGDPSLIMAGDVALQGKVWQNARAIAGAFTNFDNFYTDAEQSIQGHTWTVYGRTTDYMERTWLNIWGRGTRVVATPTLAVDGPEEGGVFAWLTKEGVGNQNMGEIIGNAPPDIRYPGLLYAQNHPDVDKSCYMAGRIRLRCDLEPFTYAVQANDHTYGGQAGAAAPEVMIAVNDEATGLLLDALSHSPTWKDSLLIVTEDDPQDGGDHVDLHRSLLLMASPWVRRGYVSHGHYDMASVYKLVAHIYGIPYHNEMIRSAMAPFDAFTSTPDYTPFTYQPRTVSAPCNPSGTNEAKEAEGWDFDDLDDQPGLSQQIMKMMKRPRGERGIRVIEPRAAAPRGP